jgi:hypothetical protein
LQILTTMVQQYLEVLYDPESFFERGEEAGTVAVPIAIMVFIGLTGGIVGWLNFQQQSKLIARMGTGGGGAESFAAIGGAISVIVALVVPFLSWLLYAGLFHGISALLEGEGEFTTTMVYAGWGFLPSTLGAVVGLAAYWIAIQAVSLPSEVDPGTIQAYQQQVQNHPAMLAAFVVGIGLLLWSAYIWVAAVEHARDVDRTDAMIAVGFPVAVVVLIRLGTRFLL